ncbi:hypothetical protein AGDE_07626 [Angomonas deanei]|uniref:Uncharacterized protein n=1 Tax=Angomonas deanei TaxID=59799 RepID=A0A7G2BYR7_9TRYP|nr:hypothetical protein AGDE_07626 [Angomonas deanei]CAD2212658.1 hypothetical protein, conserved [Angomonas deanei]|eukprot:EPY35023.1 hypothetical protein AGDE_07626 [Angomonas deanei]
MNMQVDKARAVAELAAETTLKRSTHANVPVAKKKPVLSSSPLSLSSEEQSTSVQFHTEMSAKDFADMENLKPKKKKKVFFLASSSSSDSDEDTGKGKAYTSFANEVSFDVASEFAKTMDACNKANDESKDYGLFFTFVTVVSISGRLKIADEGWLSVDVPSGLSLAESTLNDGNSNKRLSLAAKDFAVHAFVPIDKLRDMRDYPTDHTSKKYTEIFHLQTTVCVRQYTAYPFDGSLENHMYKQRQFIKNNDYEELINFRFFDVVSPPQSPHGGPNNETYPVRDPPTQARQQRVIDATAKSLQALIDQSASESEESSSEPSGQESASQKSKELSEPGTLSHELSQDDETTTSPSVDFLQRVPTCASGKDFETCLSASDASVSNFLGDSNHYDYPFDDESLMDESVPNLRPAEPPAVNKGAEFILRERIPLHRFYRVFFSTDCDENGTVLGFTTNNRKDRTSSVRYHAPLPNVPFILVEYPEEFPEYTIAREFYENCDDSEELSWATGCADNRKRSLQGSTTKHLHLELAEPLTVLVSKEFSPLVTAALRVVMAKYGARGAPLATMQTRTADFDEKVHGQMSVKPTSFIRETKKGKKSTVRKQQKRWQWEDILASAIIPCVELKLMTCLPVPSYNLPTEKAENGMYSTTLGIRGINGVLRYNRPPSGVESASSSSRKMSASVSLKCLSLVTQIEDEPIAREGKLTVDAPLIVYDESKDNIGVIYIAKIRGRGKRDVVRSAEGGACSVLVDTVGIHVTKDYISYLLSLFAMADEMRTDFMQRVYSETWSGVSSPLEAQRSSQMISSSSFHKGTVTTERGRTVQGKGNIRLFRVVMINSFKHGRYIKLDIPSSSVFEVSNTMANFVIVTPRATRDNCLHLQFIGDVDALRIKLYPSLLHCINTPSLEGGTRFLQKNDDMDGGTKESSEFPSTESGLLLLYTGTFTLHTLDISVMHSAMNYLQLRGKNLTGCAEARNDRLSSRECVQVDVLTEAISERLKARLRAKARAARERASQSRYASPSSVTGQLQLRSTASFFAEQLLLRYVAEVILPKELTTGDTPSRVDPQVIIAAIDQVAIAAQFTDQFDIVGKQINLEVSIHRVYCVSPFRPESSSTVHPQIQQIVTAWKLAAHALSSQNTDGLTTVIAQSPKKSTGKGNQNSNSGLFVSIQAKNIEGIVGLPQNISQKFFLPQLSLIVQTSSNGRVGAQVHAHPFSITSKSSTLDNYQVTLPHMYLIYAHDQIKLTCSVMVETVAITVTPLFINHTLLTIEKMKELIVATQQTIPHTNSQGAATNTGGEPAPRPGKRQTFLFLLRGLSFSYLTSMTNLRFSLKSLNATAETSVLTGFSVLDWTVHVSTLQVALVDRDDHDQMTTRSKLVPPLHKHAPKSGGASKPHTPLGGFIWGSLEFSLTLSSDMTNYNNEVQETLRKEASFQACSPELQKALLDTVGHSTYRWVLSVYSPLVILRVGLESLLKQCLDETQADIWELKNAATKEGERFRMMLSNEKTFKKLQAQKRRYDALIRKNESEHAENVRRVAERVARDVSLRRRNAIGNEESDILELLRITSKHRFVTTISNFLIVVPFGDATFKSLLEEDPKMFSCGKNTKHIHNATCILRKKTLPTLALRVGIDEITFTCGVESVRHFAPILLSDVDKSFLTSELKVTGRLFSSKLVAYFTTGSPIPSTSHLQRLLEDTVVLGGVGILTLDNREEIQKTRNTILIEIIESPFHIEKKDGVFSIGAIMDISGPKICLSSRFPIFVSQLQNEFPTTSLPHARGDSSQMSANLDEGATSENVPVQPGKSRRRSSSSSAQNNYFVLDVSARLGIGSVRFFSFGKKESQPVNDNENIFTRKFTHSSRKSQKGNKTARVVTPAEEQNIAFGGKSRMPEGNMNLMLTVPLPSVVTQIAAKRSTDMNEEDVSMVRCEIRSGSIEIGPSIIGFFKDIEQAASDYGFHKQECEKNILQKVKEIENGVTSKKIALHCTVTDLLVPVPRAYATELFNSKIRQYTSKRKTRADPPRQPCQGEQRSVVVKPSYLSIHLSLLEFSLILTSEPVASTNLTVFLGDRGSVDLLVKVYRGGSHAVLSRVPDNTIIMNVRRLRAECQTKLEVKSVEVFLPEGEVVISKRVRHDDVVNSIAVNLPFNVEGTDPNLILRVPHIAQVFTIQQLWTSVIGEALEQMKGVFLSATSPLPSVPQPISTPVQTNGNERTLVVIYVSYGLCHFDLGTGNSHQLLFGTGRLAAEKRVCGGHSGVNLLRCHISNFSTKSEGVLAGVVSIGDIIAQGFVIENMESSETFLRSPESRTFRSRVIVKNVHVAFKERQVKDVFECKSTLFDLNSMDGVGVDGYTTSDLDVLLSRATLGVTPSTVPAFLTFIKSVSFMVADQKRIANEKLKEDKVPVGRLASISTQIKEVLYSWESRRSSADNSVLRRLSESEKPFNEADTATARDSLPKDVPVIPFFGNRLTHVPCGQLRFTVDETTLLLGAISSAEATTGCVVASFPKTRLSFAECPSDDYTAAKKMLIIETRNVELYRPGSYKIVIMGFRGDNYFEFFTKQEMGSADVFFTLLLKQTHPWTGNPRFRDFEEMISLIKSFADKKNADVFQKFGSVDANFNANSAQVPPSKAASEAPAVDEEEPIPIHVDATDPRVLKALRGVNFSPQLRFGGDVSVNTEVILNWIGITEKMLPTVLNSKLCDGLEGLLDKFAEITSERTKEQI